MRKLAAFKKKGSNGGRTSSASQLEADTGDDDDEHVAGPSSATTLVESDTASVLSRYNTDVSFRSRTFTSPLESREIVGTRRPSEVEALHGSVGLTVLHSPEKGKRKADIVFVHGLGGASRKTWSKDLKPELFWPLEFLPLEADLSQARILTFGYNADFRKAGGIHVSVLDFAKDLLYELRTARDDQGEEVGVGKASQISLAHTWAGVYQSCRQTLTVSPACLAE